MAAPLASSVFGERNNHEGLLPPAISWVVHNLYLEAQHEHSFPNPGLINPFLPGMAALHEAVLTGNLDCVKLLVRYGADIHQKDEEGWTPLHMACSDGYADIAR